ncbi:MAG: DUF2071 domain-containing protein [Leptospiraceae bacterium]|nr:DUF2071 domain-containing protein [Leptospiraceae bacterium]
MPIITNTSGLLSQTEHRPYPMPGRSWTMRQTWHDLAFLHWPVPVAQLAARIPAGLDLDLFEGEAWVGVVPFRMSGIRHRFGPAVPWISAFAELNVRTYVTDHKNRPGVLFFSLDAANPVAVAVARRWFHLPYFNARMRSRRIGKSVQYRSERLHRDAGAANFGAVYGPVQPIRPAAKGSLEHWLTERYCLYTADRSGRLYRGDIHHLPWELQIGQVELQRNSMTRSHGLEVSALPALVHFVRRIDVLVWSLDRVFS